VKFPLRMVAACAALGSVPLAVPSVHSRSSETQAASAGAWEFAVSGDSRNCGDVVMPAIAQEVRRGPAQFYWHLGDFRAIYTFDEDILHQNQYLGQPLSIAAYFSMAWPDFISHQLVPFGELPVFLALGNHELVPPKTREQYVAQFADWLEMPVIRRQRLQDDPRDHLLKTYYHWHERNVDFITLDNGSTDQFDSAQELWVKGVIQRDVEDPSIATIVAGMHEALPDSISAGHSMNASAQGTESGRRVYQMLLQAEKAHKQVYVLASHSHYFMANIFNTDYIRAHGGVLPGWIIGTAGAVRYALPPEASNASAAQTNVYGYLLGTVEPDGQIHFAFHELRERDVPDSVAEQFQKGFVHWCFEHNSAVSE
jgi:Calcineurin-like phosphoesterase